MGRGQFLFDLQIIPHFQGMPSDLAQYAPSLLAVQLEEIVYGDRIAEIGLQGTHKGVPTPGDC